MRSHSEKRCVNNNKDADSILNMENKEYFSEDFVLRLNKYVK